MNIQSKLINEAMNKIDVLEGMDVDSDSYKTGVDSVMKIIDRLIEMDKFEDDRDMKRREYDLKCAQAKDEKIDHFINYGVTIFGIILPATLTVWGALKSWEFEQEGVVTSVFGRLFLNKLGPKK